MAQQKELFVKGAQELGFDATKAAKLFDLMAHFAGYGFNKSHSTAYALIAYHTAYLKAHYPHEFMAASVTFETSNPDQQSHYLQVINEMKIPLLLPDINLSDVEFTPTKDSILFGLQGIKNLGDAALSSILQEREKKPYKDILDFCKRVDLRCVNKRVLENLIMAGAMDKLPGNRAQKTNELDKIIALAQQHKEQMLTGQMGLFSLGGAVQSSSNANELYAFEPREDWPIKEKLAKEKEIAGFYLSSHPLKSYNVLSWIKTEAFSSVLEKLKNLTSIKEPIVVCAGLLQSTRVITTRKGDKMAFAQFEDMHGKADIIIFPRLYAQVQELIEDFNVFVIKGTVDITSERTCKIKANELIPVEQLFEKPKTIQHVTLTLPTRVEPELVQTLKAGLAKGATPLKIQFSENGEQLVLHARHKVACTQEILKNLEERDIKVSLTL